LNKKSKIFLTGHRGMVGTAILNELNSNGYQNILKKTSSELDLRNQAAVENLFKHERPDIVFLLAAKVGGILANSTLKADFIYDNLMIQSNVIHSSYKYNVKKLLFMGSACIYPKFANQPMKEEELLSGKLEESNEPYAVAKIAGIKLCESYFNQYESNFISIMPNNLYGPNDNFDLKESHVLPALIRKMHEAKINNKPKVEVWGTGSPIREFLYVDDLAKASVHLIKNLDAYKLYNEMQISHINVGSGEEISIRDLSLLVKEIVCYDGDLFFNGKMDGTPRKYLDIKRITDFGWKSKIRLREGIHRTYDWFKNNK
tara:strand:+ start:2704 stop:3651 length:948 start_codon:yes stop_codon:yes gene_type:complete